MQRKSSFKPRLEALEERWCPASAYTWINGGFTKNWTDANNWAVTGGDGIETWPGKGGRPDGRPGHV